MVVKYYCFDRTDNGLEEKLLGMSMMDFLEWVVWGGPTLNVGVTVPWPEVLDRRKRRK